MVFSKVLLIFGQSNKKFARKKSIKPPIPARKLLKAKLIPKKFHSRKVRKKFSSSKTVKKKVYKIKEYIVIVEKISQRKNSTAWIFKKTFFESKNHSSKNFKTKYLKKKPEALQKIVHSKIANKKIQIT